MIRASTAVIMGDIGRNYDETVTGARISKRYMYICDGEIGVTSRKSSESEPEKRASFLKRSQKT